MTDPINECGDGITDTGPDDPMLPACKVHDEDYDAHHAGTSDKVEPEVDQEFIDNMHKIVDAEPNPYRRAILAVQAALYAATVGSIGWLFWNGYLGL